MTDLALQPLARTIPGEVYVDPGFLAPEASRFLVQTYQRWGAFAEQTPENPFFSGRFLWESSLRDREPSAYLFMKLSAERIQHIASSFYGDPDVALDSIQLVKWTHGQVLSPHADNVNNDGTPNGSPQRVYSALVYLNGGFEGGETVFPRLGVRSQPEPGKLIVFKSGLEHQHAVTDVAPGVERFTMPCWFRRP